jgi:hypothetical protein
MYSYGHNQTDKATNKFTVHEKRLTYLKIKKKPVTIQNRLICSLSVLVMTNDKAETGQEWGRNKAGFKTI